MTGGTCLRAFVQKVRIMTILARDLFFRMDASAEPLNRFLVACAALRFGEFLRMRDLSYLCVAFDTGKLRMDIPLIRFMTAEAIIRAHRGKNRHGKQHKQERQTDHYLSQEISLFQEDDQISSPSRSVGCKVVYALFTLSQLPAERLSHDITRCDAKDRNCIKEPADSPKDDVVDQFPETSSCSM